MSPCLAVADWSSGGLLWMDWIDCLPVQAPAYWHLHCNVFENIQDSS